MDLPVITDSKSCTKYLGQVYRHRTLEDYLDRFHSGLNSVGGPDETQGSARVKPLGAEFEQQKFDAIK